MALLRRFGVDAADWAGPAVSSAVADDNALPDRRVALIRVLAGAPVAWAMSATDVERSARAAAASRNAGTWMSSTDRRICCSGVIATTDTCAVTPDVRESINDPLKVIRRCQLVERLAVVLAGADRSTSIAIAESILGVLLSTPK